MVIRKIKENKGKSQGKSKVKHASDIFSYINALNTPDPGQKILCSGTLNIQGKFEDEIIVEIDELARTSTSKNPFQHWTVSLREGEHLTADQWKHVVEHTVKRMEFDGCQVCWAVHGDTDNEHLHIMINLVDPVKHILRSTSKDIYMGHKAVAELTDEFKFEAKKHEMYVKDNNGKYVQAVYTKDNEDKPLPQAAIDSEIRTGEASVLRIAKEQIYPLIKNSKTWQELHGELAKNGFKYVLKGGGAVLECTINDKTIQVKSSNVHRSCSLKNVEKRLGKYVESNVEVVKRKPEPIPGISNDILKQYNEETKTNTNTVIPAENAEAILNDIKRIEVERDETLPQIFHEDPYIEKILREEYKKYTSDEIKNLKSVYKSILKSSSKSDVKLPFNKWLEQKNKETASSVLQNLNRGIVLPQDFTVAEQTLYNNFLTFNNSIVAEEYEVRGKYKKNGLIFLKESNKSNLYTAQEVASTILPKISELNKETAFSIYPKSPTRSYITVQSDKILDMMNAGLHPAYIVGNTAAFAIPHANKIVVDKIGVELARKYDGKVISTAYNLKDRIIGGTYRQCPILTEYEQILQSFYAYKHENRQQKERKHSNVSKLYYAHFDDIAKQPQEHHSNIDVNITIAARLKATGHSEREIVSILAAGGVPDAAGMAARALSERPGARTGNLGSWRRLEKRLDLDWYLRRQPGRIFAVPVKPVEKIQERPVGQNAQVVQEQPVKPVEKIQERPVGQNAQAVQEQPVKPVEKIQERPVGQNAQAVQEQPVKLVEKNQGTTPPVQPISPAARAKIEQRINAIFQQNNVNNINNAIDSTRSIFQDAIDRKALYETIQDVTAQDNFEYTKRDIEGKQKIRQRTQQKYLFNIRKDDEKSKEKLDNDNKSIFKMGG